MNTRALIGSPVFARLFAVAARELLAGVLEHTQRIAGGETAGIPFASFLAYDTALPLIYVRKQSKSYGIAGRVEGPLSKGDRVLLVEDLITDAASKLSFVQALRDQGALVKDALVVFDREQGGGAALGAVDVHLHALATMTVALEAGLESGHITRSQLEIVSEYIASPADWHKRRGLTYATPIPNEASL